MSAKQHNMTSARLEPAIPGSVGRCLLHWATGPCAPLANFRHAATAGRCRANADEKENSSPVEFATQALPSYPSTSPLLGKLEHTTPLGGGAPARSNQLRRKTSEQVGVRPQSMHARPYTTDRQFTICLSSRHAPHFTNASPDTKDLTCAIKQWTGAPLYGRKPHAPQT